MSNKTHTDVASDIIIQLFQENPNKEIQVSKVKKIVRDSSGIEIGDNVFAGLFNKFCDNTLNKHNKKMRLHKCGRGFYKYIDNESVNKVFNQIESEEIFINTKAILDRTLLDIKEEINSVDWSEKDPKYLIKLRTIIESIEKIYKSI